MMFREETMLNMYLLHNRILGTFKRPGNLEWNDPKRPRALIRCCGAYVKHMCLPRQISGGPVSGWLAIQRAGQYLAGQLSGRPAFQLARYPACRLSGWPVIRLAGYLAGWISMHAYPCIGYSFMDIHAWICMHVYWCIDIHVWISTLVHSINCIFNELCT